MRAFLLLLLFSCNGINSAENSIQTVAEVLYNQSFIVEKMFFLLQQEERTLKRIIARQKKIMRTQKKLDKTINTFENMLFGRSTRGGVFSRLERLEHAQEVQIKLNLLFIKQMQQQLNENDFVESEYSVYSGDEFLNNSLDERSPALTG